MTLELNDDERGKLIVSAACYGLKWSVILGTFFLAYSWAFFPDMIDSALWWYPGGFVGVFLWKRKRLLEQANEIINRTNARIKEEIHRA